MEPATNPAHAMGRIQLALESMRELNQEHSDSRSRELSIAITQLEIASYCAAAAFEKVGYDMSLWTKQKSWTKED